jgi:hypothetical protein
LIRIAFQSDNLTLSQIKLARMLMVRKDSGYTAIDMLGHEQEGLDALVGFHCVFDSLSNVQATISCFQKNSIEWASYWKGAKKPFQVVAIHDLKHPAQRPLVNSVLEAEAGYPQYATPQDLGKDAAGIVLALTTFDKARAHEMGEHRKAERCSPFYGLPQVAELLGLK